MGKDIYDIYGKDTIKVTLAFPWEKLEVQYAYWD